MLAFSSCTVRCSIPHCFSCFQMGASLWALSERLYSILGGISACAVRITRPSLSSSCRCSVSMRSVILDNFFFSSLKRMVFPSSFYRMSSFHLPPSMSTAYTIPQKSISLSRLIVLVEVILRLAIIYIFVCSAQPAVRCQRGMLQFTGFTVLRPHILYAPARQSTEDRAAELAQWRSRLQNIFTEESFEVGMY